MTQATASKGTRFQRSNGDSPETFTTIAELKNIAPPDETRETADATNHDSLGDRREYIPGLIEGGTVPITGNYIWGNASQESLYDDFTNATVQTFRILRKTIDQGRQFQGIVTRFAGPTAPLEGINEFTAEIKVTGPITFIEP